MNQRWSEEWNARPNALLTFLFCCQQHYFANSFVCLWSLCKWRRWTPYRFESTFSGNWWTHIAQFFIFYFWWMRACVYVTQHCSIENIKFTIFSGKQIAALINFGRWLLRWGQTWYTEFGYHNCVLTHIARNIHLVDDSRRFFALQLGPEEDWDWGNGAAR